MTKEKNKKENSDDDLMGKIVSLCKRRGFVFQGSEIYGGLAGTYDWAHFGVALKNNIKQSWWKKFVDDRKDMYSVDAAILMRQEVWQATGHVANFADPFDGKQFNTMLKTQVGAGEEATTSYLRPETAQGMFVNFKNTVDSFHPKLPFGMAQIGKAFRNEIAPRDFLFRQREFEQMEIEYFVHSSDWEKYFEYWKGEMLDWMEEVGIDMGKVHELEVEEADRAHYSKRTIDFQFDFPFGRNELFGLAYRADFDLKTHKLEYLDEEEGEKIIPHVIEPTFGLDRAVLSLLLSAYAEDPEGKQASDGAGKKGKKKEYGKLVIRQRRDGTGTFISCSRYPKCKFIKKDEAEEARKRTGVICPVCKKGDISERRGRFGIFYSCSNYPDCKFAIKAKPTGNICKECGSLMMEGTKTIPERCSNKTCKMHNPHKIPKIEA